jgi:hypothetical protein
MKIQIDNNEYWVGTHLTRGLVVYDSDAQDSMKSQEVLLYVVAQGQMLTFAKERVKEYLVPLNANCEATNAVNLYLNFRRRYMSLRQRNRVTHCYKCQSNLNSMRFPIGLECEWIKCTCGACGCDYG